jgi:hypothetical protein
MALMVARIMAFNQDDQTINNIFVPQALLPYSISYISSQISRFSFSKLSITASFAKRIILTLATFHPISTINTHLLVLVSTPHEQHMKAYMPTS